MNRHLGCFFCANVLVALLAAAAPALAQEETYTPGKGSPRGSNKAPAKKNLKEEGQGLFKPGKEAPAGEAPGAAAWSIVIRAFREDDQATLAQAALTRVKTEGGLPGAYLETRGAATVVAYGRYTDGASKEAQADLAKVRNTEVVMNGEKAKPFAAAFLAPPAEIPGTIPEYDLRNARKLNGDWVLYTLQIGVYGRGDGKPATQAELEEFRRTSEKAVVQLRHEGEQAFYYHGPHLSSVTVGLFSKDDFDPETKFESPALHALRQRYPYNLQNGMGIRQHLTVTDPKTQKAVKASAMQPSGLMNVPKD